jgi:hypothetical protein
MAATRKPKTDPKETPAGGKKSVSKSFKKADKPKKPKFGGYVAPLESQRIKLPGRTRFLISAAQNNTKVFEGFVRALETNAKDTGAQIIISQFTYNQNGYQNDTKDNIKGAEFVSAVSKDDVRVLQYDKRIQPYLLQELRKNGDDHNGANKSIELVQGLIFGGELNIQPTAVEPFSGLATYFRGNNSGIIPHAKQYMESLPGMKEDGARFLYSTGTVTKRNYIQKKAGQKADKHHTYGALVVEIDEEGDWFVRQIQADKTGAFYDIDPKTGTPSKYLPSGEILRNQRPEAITWGDVHVEKIDPAVEKAAWGPGGMLDALAPRKQFLHDIIDFTSRNHHNIKDPFFRHSQHFHGKNNVEGEISLTAKFLKAAERPNVETYVVEGNHDRAFVKWLRDLDNVKNDPANEAYFLETRAKILRAIEKDGIRDAADRIFEWAVREKEKLERTEFIPLDKSFVTCESADDAGIENALHGDVASNGTKGTPKGFRKVNRKVITGHTHSAGIFEGIVTVGVCQTEMGYNKGPSSWSITHGLTYPNAARSLLTMKKSKYHAAFNKAAAKPAPEQDNKPTNVVEFKKAATKKATIKAPKKEKTRALKK